MNVPAPPPPPSAGYSAQPTPDPLQRKKKQTRIIVVAAMAVVLLIGLSVGGLLAMIFSFVRSSEPYQHAVQMATTDLHVIEELGAPVKPAWLFNGSIEESGPSGSADISIGLTGSRRKGTLYVVAKKSAGRWRYEVLELRAEGQPDLDLRQPPGTR
jgi:Cytochrome oxidase complex assembly protein 1